MVKKSFDIYKKKLADNNLTNKKDLSTDLSSEVIIKRACKEFLEVMSCTTISILLYNERSKLLYLFAEYNSDGSEANEEASYYLSEYPSSAKVINEHATVKINESDENIDPDEKVMLNTFDTKNLLMVPLIVNNKAIGVVELYDNLPDRQLSDDDMAFVKDLCDQIAFAVHNARIVEEMQRQNVDLEFLNESIGNLANQIEKEDFLQRLVGHIANTFHAASCEVSTKLPDQEAFTVSAYYNVSDEFGFHSRVGKQFYLANQKGVTEATMAHKTFCAYADDLTMSEFERKLMTANNISASLYVPVIYEDNPVGLLTIMDDNQARRFTEEDEHLAEIIAHKVAIAFNNIQILSKQEASNRELKLFLDTAKTIATTLDLSDALSIVTGQMAKALDVSIVDFYGYHKKEDEIEFLSSYIHPDLNIKSEDWIGKRYKVSEWPGLDTCIQNGDPVTIYMDDPDLSRENIERRAEFNEKALMSLPIFHQDQVVGIIDIIENRYKRRFTAKDIQIGIAIGEQVAVAIHNARLFKESRQRSEDLETILKAVEVVTSTVDIDIVLKTLAEQLSSALNTFSAEIYYYNMSNQMLILAADSDESPYENEWDGTIPAGELPGYDGCLKKMIPVISYIDNPDLDDEIRSGMSEWGEKSALNMPMIYNKQVVGLVRLVEVQTVRRFSENDIQLARMIAAQGAVAIQNARTFKREKAEKIKYANINKKLNSLIEVSGQLQSVMEEEELLKLMGQAMATALGYRAWLAYMYDAENKKFRLSVIQGENMLDNNNRKGIESVSVLESLISDAEMISNSYFVDHNLHRWSDAEHACFICDELGPREAGEWQTGDMLLVPMMGRKGQLLGYIEAYDPVDKQRPTKDSVRLLELFIEKAGSSIEMARLYEKLSHQATIDGLTGLYNRRYMDKRLNEELVKSLRYKMPLSIIMMDIDNFKHYNDAYGHPRGDELLKEISTIITYNIREKIDMAARYGGEEFLVMLPNTNIRNGYMTAERIRSAIEMKRFKGHLDELDVRITMSLGLSAYPDYGDCLETVIGCADKALYQAKHSGKNQVCMLPSQKGTGEPGNPISE
ncbi:MAG: diguanylate cyclase [Desulfobacterales bacterium]|nr:diguanylate cyclase [Desulfobacterales bacterium]